MCIFYYSLVNTGIIRGNKTYIFKKRVIEGKTNMTKKEKEYNNYITALETFQSLTIEAEAYDPSEFIDPNWVRLSRLISEANEILVYMLNQVSE